MKFPMLFPATASLIMALGLALPAHADVDIFFPKEVPVDTNQSIDSGSVGKVFTGKKYNCDVEVLLVPPQAPAVIADGMHWLKSLGRDSNGHPLFSANLFIDKDKKDTNVLKNSINCWKQSDGYFVDETHIVEALEDIFPGITVSPHDTQAKVYKTTYERKNMDDNDMIEDGVVHNDEATRSARNAGGDPETFSGASLEKPEPKPQVQNANLQDI
jgi:hypothetical protein